MLEQEVQQTTVRAKTEGRVNQTPFQGQLVVLKVMLEDAKAKLSEREWAALRACLHIYLAAEDEKAG